MPAQAARVDFEIATNETWSDALQFGVSGDTTWSFTGQNFRLDIKGDDDDLTALLSITSGTGQIVVDDAVNRVLHFNVPDTTLVGPLVGETCYDYDFIMYDNAVPAKRVRLMYGKIKMIQGITGN